jgi:hypothetical protein
MVALREIEKERCASDPLSTYESAIWRMVERSVSGRWSERVLSAVLETLADIYWLTPKKVRADFEAKKSEVQ